MLSSLQSQYHTVQTRHTTQLRRGTPVGNIMAVTRHTFAMYCIYRIVSTGYSLLRRLLTTQSTTSESDDPVSAILAFLTKASISTTHIPLDAEAYRRLISFILVGVVIAGSITAVGNTVQRLSRSSPLSPAVSALGEAWIAGTYFVSTAVMLRSNLPERYVGGIGDALGNASLRRGLFEGWFDFVFFGVAALTGVGLVIARKWNEEDAIELEGKEV
jgi:Abscisic acid G-protein coupled receptor